MMGISKFGSLSLRSHSLLLIALVSVVSVSAVFILNQQITASNTAPISIKGHVVMVLYDQNGVVKENREFNNLITNAGFDGMSAAISGDYSAAYKYIAIGTGTMAAAAIDTALESEATRALGTYAHTAGTKVFTVTASFAAGVGTGAVSEAGVLNAASDGTLLSRQTFGVINKGALDSLQITWTYTLS